MTPLGPTGPTPRAHDPTVDKGSDNPDEVTPTRVHVSIVGNDLARWLARLVLSCGVCQTLVATGLATPTVAQISPRNASAGLLSAGSESE